MKGFITQRYYLHLIIGFCLAYIGIHNTDFNTFSTPDKIAGGISITALVFMIAGIYEWVQTLYVQSQQPDSDTWDWTDVHFSGIGGAFGVILYYNFDSNVIYYGCIATTIIAIIYEIVRIVKAK